MNTTLDINFNGKTEKVAVASYLYQEQQAWQVKLPDGKEFIFVNNKGVWSSLNESEYNKEMVAVVIEAISKAIASGKEPFATISTTEPPPAELF